MGVTGNLVFVFGILALSGIVELNAESPYKFYDWEITYGTISPLGVPRTTILVNGQFPGPTIDCDTNDNVVVNIVNKLDEPFLMTWNGIWQRKMSWQDGVLGTNCPIPPGSNWTYAMQAKDQIGSFSYSPSTSLHRLGGGFGAFNVHRRSVIPIPYPEPADQFTFTVGDWHNTDFKVIREELGAGNAMPAPDGILINGHPSDTVFTGEAGKTYMFRVANVGTMLSVNVRIQGHVLKLVEVEGSHVLQEVYESLDIHPGQSMSFLVTFHGMVKDYHIVASGRFTKKNLYAKALLHYVGSTNPPADPLPIGPTYEIHWSMKQARTLRWDLKANAARPNPQGSYHYGAIQITRTLILANSAGKINGTKRYAVNDISYVNPDTPLKLADYYNIPDVFNLNTIKDAPTPGMPMEYGTSVVGLTLHDFVEIIFQNNETTLQSWHLDGHNFFVVAYGAKEWTPAMRKKYNMIDSVWRTTVQVYPNSWTAVLVSLDNKGMWNLRSAILHRRYLGQELYFRVWNDEKSLRTENDIPPNAVKCGKAVNYY